MHLRSCLIKVVPNRLLPLGSVLPIRSFSSASQVMKKILNQHEKPVMGLDNYKHSVLDKFELQSNSDPTKVELTRKFETNETVSVSFRVGDMDYVNEEKEIHISSTPDILDKLGLNHKGPDPTYFFRVELSKPDQPKLEFTLNLQESSKKVSMMSIKVNRGDSYYELDFDDLHPFVQDSLSDYLNERLGDNVAQFILQYYDLKEENLYQVWLKDMQNFVS